MAERQNRFKLKRSNVSGKIPTISDLFLGEVALNTADVKMYADYTGGATGATEVRQIGWDRISRTGDTMDGNLTINGELTVTGNTSLKSTNVSELFSSGSITATTYYGDGSNLTGINDIYTTGGTRIGSTIYFDRNDTLSAYTVTLGAGSGDVTAASNLQDNSIIRGDGGGKGVQDSGVIISDSDGISGVTTLDITGSQAGHLLTIRNNTSSGEFIRCFGPTGNAAFEINQGGGVNGILRLFDDGASSIEMESSIGSSYIDLGDPNGEFRIGGVDVIMPSGGTAGQVLEKVDGTSYNTQWATPTGGSGNSDMVITTVDLTVTSPHNAVETANRTDVIVVTDFDAGDDVTLPSSPTTGHVFHIKDDGGTAAGGKRINVLGNGNNIDGSASQDLRTSYETMTVVYNGTQWNRI